MSTPSTTTDTQIPQLTQFEDVFSEEVWASTYKDHSDNNINDTLYRVAKAVASVEDTEELCAIWTNEFYQLLSNFRGTAGGRIYANAGTTWGGTTMMNCFVGPRVEYDVDSLDGILTHLRSQAHTLKAEGGWGENFSYIRPRGAFIHGVGVETPGAVKYMELFDKASEIITSGSGKKSTNKKAKGKIRKGAMMAVLDVWHPDIIEFITAKQQSGRLTKFNISVNCTDAFMERVMKIQELEGEMASAGASYSHIPKEDFDFDTCNDIVAALDEWDLIFPDTTHPKYKATWQGDIKKWQAAGNPVIVYNTISVKWLWNLIMESTYNRAEPGVLFLDRANHFLPLNYAETAYATNPCGEQVLAPGGVCNLGSLNLTQFLNADWSDFDYDEVKKYTRIMVRFLDNINSLTRAPLPEYEYSMKNKRRIGLGILGWGSALYMLRARFASDKAAELRDKVMSTIARTAYEASIDLAAEKGMFTLCEPTKHAANPFVQSLGLSDEYTAKLLVVGIRNSSLLSIQPTGNTSIFAQVTSGGLEPTFMHEYIRTVIVNHIPEGMEGVTPKWFEGEWYETEMFKTAKEGDEEILRGEFNGVVYKIDKNRGLTKEVLCEDYGVRQMKRKGLWDPTADWAVTAMSLSVSDHVSDLKGFARWVDSSMSKTVNVPNDYPFEDFKRIYTDTYASGVVKGVTTYRAGTMTTVLSAKDENNPPDEEIILDDVDLPDSLPAVRKKLRAENRKWYMTVSFLNDRPVEFFVQTNHHEKTATTHDAVERLIALARTKGIPERHVDKVSEKIAGDSNVSKLARCISFLLRHGVLIRTVVVELDRVDNVYVGSFLFAIRKYLGSFIKDGEKIEGERCQECGSTQVIYSEGCHKCVQCGSSKCG